MLLLLFKQKTAYEMRISDWSSRRVLFRSQVGYLVARALNVPLPGTATLARLPASRRVAEMEFHFRLRSTRVSALYALLVEHGYPRATAAARSGAIEGLMHGYVDLLYRDDVGAFHVLRSEEHTSELQSLMRLSYAV